MKPTKAKSLPTQPIQQLRRYCKPITIEIDKHIGQRVRMRRKILRMSQADVGVELGVSYQQIQKYEVGLNRLSFYNLCKISKIFFVPVSYFYEGADEIADNGAEEA